MSRTKHVARVGTVGRGESASAAALTQYDPGSAVVTASASNVEDAIKLNDAALAGAATIPTARVINGSGTEILTLQIVDADGTPVSSATNVELEIWSGSAFGGGSGVIDYGTVLTTGAAVLTPPMISDLYAPYVVTSDASGVIVLDLKGGDKGGVGYTANVRAQVSNSGSTEHVGNPVWFTGLTITAA